MKRFHQGVGFESALCAVLLTLSAGCPSSITVDEGDGSVRPGRDLGPRVMRDGGPGPTDGGPRPTDGGPPGPTCFDGLLNGDETDVDCGGICDACDINGACRIDGDCVAGTRCDDGFCRTPICANGMLDPGEVAIDCGGDCPGCVDGTACTADEDCRSNRCEAGFCRSCSDGLQNGDETDTDCGGSACAPCGGGDACLVGSDCRSGECTDGTCEAPEAFYEEPFDTMGGWTTGGSNGSWEYGTPSSATIDSAFTGTRVWVTNADGDYNDREESWVESPAFDLSSALGDPTFEAAVFYRTESCCDEWWLELSTDGGSSWTKVTGSADAVGWYNDVPSQWWDGRIPAWTSVRTVLTGAAGHASVKLRFRVSTDGSITDEGFAFDDVRVFEDVCRNGRLDAGEVDVDCGGACGLCGAGATCSTGATCASGICTGGLCDTATYFQSDFEANDGGLTATGGLWEWGAPVGAVINAASSGSNAWVTDLDAEHGDRENATLELPLLDFSGLAEDPVIGFDAWLDTERNFDGMWVEVSTNGGATWTKVVDDGTFLTWHPNTGDVWFEGATSGYQSFAGVLTGTAGEANVRVRFVFESDGSVTNDGVAIDDLYIGTGAPDLAVEVLPSATLCEGARVSVRNRGTAGAASFTFVTVLDGMRTETTIPGLARGDVYETTVAASATVEVSVVASGDTTASNDSASLLVGAGIPVSSGSTYLETFESSAGAWVTAGTLSDWQWGTPDGFFIGTADSGSRAWVTNLEGRYADGQMSVLVSPCFDLSSFGADPTFSFSRIFDLQPTNDHVHVEVSTDGGRTWSKLGRFGSGTGWYNDAAGDYWDGSSGTRDVWSRSSHPITGGAGRSGVRFRFVMVSDASFSDDGFGVDDVVIAP